MRFGRIPFSPMTPNDPPPAQKGEIQRIGKPITPKEAFAIAQDIRRQSEEGLRLARERDAEEMRCPECKEKEGYILQLEARNDSMEYAIGWFIDRYNTVGGVDIKTAYELFSSLTPPPSER